MLSHELSPTIVNLPLCLHELDRATVLILFSPFTSLTNLKDHPLRMIDSELLYIFGVSAIGAASVAYIFFGPSPSYRKQIGNSKNVPIRGLKNVKNNCFINSILQSIASSESMVVWLNYANITAKSNGKLIQQISSIINKINQNSNWEEVLTPHDVLNALREHRWVFSNEEQDAFELFNLLTSTLENELKKFSFIFSIQEIFCDYKEITSCHILKNYTISTRATGKTPLAHHLYNTLPTRGILANHLICRNCHYKYPLHLDIFDSITLSLPARSANSSILLENCLSKFVSSELIDDFMCEACKQKATFDKKVEFIKLPKVLCFHIQRLVWLASEMPQKRLDHVEFSEFLEMDPYTYKYHSEPTFGQLTFALTGLVGGQSSFSSELSFSGPSESVPYLDSINESPPSHPPVKNSLPKAKLIRYKYILKSVIVHLGNSSSGHFICYRRQNDAKSNRVKWYLTSDMAVREVNQSEVFSSSAYMLFYERSLDLLM